MRYLVGLTWLLITVVLCIITYKSGADTSVVSTDTVVVTRVDTIVRTQPMIVSADVKSYQSYRVKLLGVIGKQNDSIGKQNCKQNDSVEVELPITQRVYEDSTYRAYVSGYDARLDSIMLFPPTKYVTITKKEPHSNWGIGIQGGYGITPKGLQPYIGIGISYNFKIK